MNVLDVNVLLALFRADHPYHSAARAWWSLHRRVPLVVPDLVWVAFLRLGTSPRVLAEPSTFGEAWDFVTAVRSLPSYRSLPENGVLDLSANICRESRASGNLVNDAYIAAVAVSVGAGVVTFDRDFRKFDGVRVVELTGA